MNKKYLSLCLLLVSLLVIAGCQKKPPKKEFDFASIERIDIPVGDSLGISEAALTRNFYFIFDGSGSMNDPPDGECTGDQEFNRKIKGAKWAIHEFMKKVPEDINIGLYVFDNVFGKGEVISLGTKNRDEFLAAIDRIEPGGNTPLANAIRFGTDQLIAQYKKQLGYGEFRLVVITDGIASGILEAVLYAAQRGIPIYAIGLCIGDEHPLRQYALSYRAADSFEDLAKGLEETLAELETFDITEFEENR